MTLRFLLLTLSENLYESLVKNFDEMVQNGTR